jgi:hypothetical protein
VLVSLEWAGIFAGLIQLTFSKYLSLALLSLSACPVCSCSRSRRLFFILLPGDILTSRIIAQHDRWPMQSGKRGYCICVCPFCRRLLGIIVTPFTVVPSKFTAIELLLNWQCWMVRARLHFQRNGNIGISASYVNKRRRRSNTCSVV